MIKLKKSEKRLLVLLVLVLLIAGYYFFFYRAKETELASLQSTLHTQQTELTNMVARIKNHKTYSDDIRHYQSIIEQYAAHYYGDLSQEAFVMIVDELAKAANLKVTAMYFSDDETNLQEQIEPLIKQNLVTREQVEALLDKNSIAFDNLDSTLLTNHTTLEFEGTYKQLKDFLEAVQSHDKRINITTTQINAERDTTIRGSIDLSVTSIPALEDFIKDYYVNQVFNQVVERSAYDNIFEPYSGYREIDDQLYPPADDGQTFMANDFDFSQVENDAHVENTGDGAPLAQTQTSQEVPDSAVLLHDFKTENYYFVPANRQIKGQLETRDGKAILSYQFADLTARNEASLVFQEGVLMLNQAARVLSVNAKQQQTSKVELLATLISADGKRLEISFGELTEADRWQLLSVKLPAELEYPAMIQRLYLRSEGLEQRLDGNIQFDDLNVQY